MARHVKPSADPFKLHVMHVEDIGKLRSYSLQPLLQSSIASDLISGLDRRRLAVAALLLVLASGAFTKKEYRKPVTTARPAMSIAVVAARGSRLPR